MRSRSDEWFVVAILIISFVCLALALIFAKAPINPSIGWLVLSFWIPLATCTEALVRLASDKKADEDK